MDFVAHLWLPVVVATAVCFILSALAWTVLPHHKTEWKGPPNQDGMMDLLRQGGAQAGAYLFPHADRSDKAAFAEAMKKFAEGPAGVMFIFPRGPMNMGKMMGQQVVFFLVVNALLAWIGYHLPLFGDPVGRVFRMLGTIAFMTYFLASVPESIWFGRPWKSLVLQGVDAVLYTVASAGILAWLWPR